MFPEDPLSVHGLFLRIQRTDCDGIACIGKKPILLKVDEKGQQQPYVDELDLQKFRSSANFTQNSRWHGRCCSSRLYRYDVLVKTWRGGYEFVEWSSVSRETLSQLHLNQAVATRELFQNPDFRQALSIAVDREEYSHYFRWLCPRQAGLLQKAMGYTEEWANKWTEYNPEKARQLLEPRSGYGADGYYDFADERIVLNLQTFTDAMLMILQNFDEIL